MKKKEQKSKDKYLYIITLCIFIILVFSITATYLFIYKESRGRVNIIKDYYEVIFSNVATKDDLSVKISGNVINVEINDINSLLTPKVFYVDVTNIGNVNVKVDGVYISNISNNDIGKNVIVETSILKDDILKGAQQKKLKIEIRYDGLIQSNESYKFNINYLFKELSL